MPSASTPSKRVALAPVNINIASPIYKHKPRLGALPLTPSLTPKLVPRSQSVIVDSSHALPTRHLESFSEYKITNLKNVKADLAATKLKLRLQLALYKLRAQRDALQARTPAIKVTKHTKTFTASANVNLQRPRAANRPLLSAVAAKGSLRLYHIKRLSSFHNAYPHVLPLTNQRLPSVHKILKTPIKATRNLLQYYVAAGVTGASDETIDEVEEKKKDDLGSSPLRPGFGTPNSFLVAKSLLQLGLGHY